MVMEQDGGIFPGMLEDFSGGIGGGWRPARSGLMDNAPLGLTDCAPLGLTDDAPLGLRDCASSGLGERGRGLRVFVDVGV